MRAIKIGLIIVVTLVMFGCATQSQFNNQARAISTAYAAEITADPELAPLWKRTPSSKTDEITFDQMTNEAKADVAEKVAIRRWAQRYEKFGADQISLQRQSNVDGRATALLRQFIDAGNNLRAQLHNGELSWGLYNRKRKEITGAFDKALADVNAAIEASNAQAAAGAAAFAQQTYTNVLLQQATMPRSTVCNRIGSAVYCN